MGSQPQEAAGDAERFVPKGKVGSSDWRVRRMSWVILCEERTESE